MTLENKYIYEILKLFKVTLILVVREVIFILLWGRHDGMIPNSSDADYINTTYI